MKPYLGIALLAIVLGGCGAVPGTGATTTDAQGNKTTTVTGLNGQSMTTTEKANGDTSMTIGGAKIDSAAGADNTGVPVYPGATPSGKATTTTMATVTSAYASYTTPDDGAKVEEFYKEKLGPKVQKMEGSNGDGIGAVYTLTDGKNTTIVGVNRKTTDTTTTITVAKTTTTG